MTGDFFVLGITCSKLQATCHIFAWPSVFRRDAIVPTELPFSEVQCLQQVNQAQWQRSHSICPTAPLQQSDPAPGLRGALSCNQCQTGKFCLVPADCPAGFPLREGQARHSQVFVQ